MVAIQENVPVVPIAVYGTQFWKPGNFAPCSLEDAEPFATGMDVDEQRVWSWKDELPRRGLAWYGNFVASRGSFLSPSLLRWLYPAHGGTDDHTELDLSLTAHEIASPRAQPARPLGR